MALTYRTRNAATTRTDPGKTGLGRVQVAGIQRGRLLAATVDVVREVGYARMTVARVIARARVSRKTFYDTFSDREECFLAAFEQALDHARELAVEAYDREPDWHDGIRAALRRLLVFMDEQPALAKLCVIEALGAGETVLQRRAGALEEIAAVIDRGRLVTRGGGCQPPQFAAEAVTGAVFAVVHARLLEGAREPLEHLVGSLMSMIVLPYLGADVACRELSTPLDTGAIRRAPRRPREAQDPLAGLNIRLTYRTVGVLMIIAERPGASNREIADGSGIADQGQISKLLTRLERLKLVENMGDGAEKGAANAWHLTRRGALLERSARVR